MWGDKSSLRGMGDLASQISNVVIAPGIKKPKKKKKPVVITF